MCTDHVSLTSTDHQINETWSACGKNNNVLRHQFQRSIFNKTVVCNGVQFISNILPENIPLDVEIMDLSVISLVSV